MISLQVIEEIEENYGGIYQLAENLVNKSLPQTIAEDILNYIGYEIETDETAQEALSFVLLDVLESVERLEAVELGELLAA